MTKRVYIIEDDKRNLKLFIAIFKTMPDVEIYSEIRGDTGLELIKSGNPDLIILDINLPVMNGIEIGRKLRKIEKFKNIPIIAVTSFAMRGDKERILAAGFNEYTSKPIRVSEFRKLVNKYLE